MPVFIVSAFHGKVCHTGKPSSVTCRESTLVESQMTDCIGIKRRKQPTQVIGLVDGTSVNKKQILIIFASPDKHTGKSFRTGRYTGLKLKRLDDIRFTQKCRYVSDSVIIHYSYPHLRVPELINMRGSLDYFLQIKITHCIFCD